MMRLKPGFAAALLMFLVLAIYYPSLYAPFNSLDDQLLVQQLLNQGSFSFARHFSPGGTYDYFRPLLTLTYEIDKYLGGLQETFMHLFNILLHSLNTILVFMVARGFSRFNGQENLLLPFLSAILFGLHPINSEAVNWIAGRTDLLAGTFIFTALLLTLLMLERRILLFGVVAAVALLCGSLCKETALFLVPGIFFLLIWRTSMNDDFWKDRWWLMGFCCIAVMIYFVLRWGAFDTDRGLSHTSKVVSQLVATQSASQHHASAASMWIPIKNVIVTIAKATGFYAIKLFQPLPLNFAINKIDLRFLIPGVLVVSILPFVAYRRRPIGVFFLISAFLGSSALLVIFTRLAWTPIAERYMYAPCGIFSIAIASGTASLVNRLKLQKLCMVIVPVYLVFFAWVTIDRNFVWQDNLTLYQDTVRKSPDFAPAKNELALALYSRHRSEEAENLIKANRISDSQAASLNQASVLTEQKRYGEARAVLDKRLLNPAGQEVRILLMLVRVNTEMAERELDRSKRRAYYLEVVGWLERLEAITHDPFYWYRLGSIHLILDNRKVAGNCFAKATVRLPPDSIYLKPAMNLARKLSI